MKRSVKSITEKHSLFLRISHWINVVLLSLMIWSGLLIYRAYPAYIYIPASIGPFKIRYRLAEAMGWHFLLMWPFLINGILYFLYVIFSKEGSELFPKKSDFKKAVEYILYDLKLRPSPPLQEGKFNAVQKFAYTGAILMGVGLIFSGLAIYKPVQLGWLTACLGGYQSARLIHFILTAGFIMFIIVHLIQVIRSGWNNFRAMVAGYETHEE